MLGNNLSFILSFVSVTIIIKMALEKQTHYDGLSPAPPVTPLVIEMNQISC